jgi:hypothetical protein
MVEFEFCFMFYRIIYELIRNAFKQKNLVSFLYVFYKWIFWSNFNSSILFNRRNRQTLFKANIGSI